MTRPTVSTQDLVQSDNESCADEHFEELNITYPVCVLFQPKSDDEELCMCNRPQKYRKHKRGKQLTLKPIDSGKKNRNHVTKSEREQAHGRLINGSLYARIDKKIKFEKVQQLLCDVWKLPTPKMIISIIGGANKFVLTDRLETNFINAITSVATKKDVWLVSSGYNNGLGRLIGQAFHKAKIRKPKQKLFAVAICKWGSIKDPETLIKSDRIESNKKESANDYSSDDEPEKDSQKVVEQDLDMNHSHYLMLDDAIYGHMDTGDYRTKLCNHIATLDRSVDTHIPVITVVTAGGDTTISNIYYDLRMNTPVVLINGSGHAADFFSRWLLYTKNFDYDYKKKNIIYEIDELKLIEARVIPDPENTRKQTGKTDSRLCLHEVEIDSSQNKLNDMFSKIGFNLKNDLIKLLYDDENYDATENDENNHSLPKEFSIIYAQVMFCLQPSIRSNITIFNLNSDNDLSETIFRSACQAYENLEKSEKFQENISSNNNHSEQKKKHPLLALAMDWDCINVAKEFVFKNSLESISNKHDAFIEALKYNLYTFVDEFLKLGHNPADTFFPRGAFSKKKEEDRYKYFIKQLYDPESVDRPETRLQAFIDANKSFEKKEITTIDGLNVIMRSLIGDYMHKLYFSSATSENLDRIESGLKKIVKNSTDVEKSSSEIDDDNLTTPSDYIMRDLFLWAILMNYVDMAKVLLAHMKYRICPALIATKILKQYHHNAAHGDLKKKYLEDAEYFEQYAIDCVDKCDDKKIDTACEIILQRNALYGYVTCLQVAADADDKLFIATPCCVHAMENIWYDKMLPTKSSTQRLAIIVSVLTLGLLAPVIVEYRDCQKSNTGENLKRELKSSGINYSDSYPLEYPRRIPYQLSVNRYFYRVKNFHQSLFVKFCCHLITYILFLLFFSYFLLFDFEPPTNETPSIHWTEILTIILVSCMLVAEIHYFCTQDSLTIYGKLKNYFRDKFKLMLFFAFVLFYIGLILRFRNADSEEEFTAARVVMAIDIELWWLYSLSFIIVIPDLGPHLVAIVKMLEDLLFFVYIIIIVIAGYGVSSRSMAYYPIANNFTTETGGSIDPSFDGRSVFRQIIYPVYYFLHGEFGGELSNLDTNPNAGWSITTHVLLAAHMLFVNILLTNLLIAMFSKRFDEIYEDTRKIWHSQQYLFTREYFTRSPFFPPISFAYDIYYLCRMFVFAIRRRASKSADRKVKTFKMIPKNKNRIKKWFEFEGALTYEYAQAQVKAVKNALIKSSTGQDSDNTNKKDETINNQKDSNSVNDSLRQVQDKVANLNVAIEGLKGEFDSNPK